MSMVYYFLGHSVDTISPCKQMFAAIRLLYVNYNFCRAMLCKRGLCRHAVFVCVSLCVCVCVCVRVRHVRAFCQNE